MQLDQLAVCAARPDEAHSAVQVCDRCRCGCQTDTAQRQANQSAIVVVREQQQVQAALVVTEQEARVVVAHVCPALQTFETCMRIWLDAPESVVLHGLPWCKRHARNHVCVCNLQTYCLRDICNDMPAVHRRVHLEVERVERALHGRLRGRGMRDRCFACDEHAGAQARRQRHDECSARCDAVTVPAALQHVLAHHVDLVRPHATRSM